MSQLSVIDLTRDSDSDTELELDLEMSDAEVFVAESESEREMDSWDEFIAQQGGDDYAEWIDESADNLAEARLAYREWLDESESDNDIVYDSDDSDATMPY